MGRVLSDELEEGKRYDPFHSFYEVGSRVELRCHHKGQYQYYSETYDSVAKIGECPFCGREW